MVFFMESTAPRALQRLLLGRAHVGAAATGRHLDPRAVARSDRGDGPFDPQAEEVLDGFSRRRNRVHWAWVIDMAMYRPSSGKWYVHDRATMA
jgi:hypothetical protein